MKLKDGMTYEKAQAIIDSANINPGSYLTFSLKDPVDKVDEYSVTPWTIFKIYFYAKSGLGKAREEKMREIFNAIFPVTFSEFDGAVEKTGVLTETRSDSVKNFVKRLKGMTERTRYNDRKLSQDTLNRILEYLNIEKDDTFIRNYVVVPNLLRAPDLKDFEEDFPPEKELSAEDQSNIEDLLSGLSAEELRKMIDERQGRPRKTAERISSTPARDPSLMELYKRMRHHTCQFCGTTIEKADGRHYIEACHINPVGNGGDDNKNNILILCPNCHKLFDYGKKEIKEHTEQHFVVKLNGRVYKADF
jgi:hypothetical protein